MSAHERFARGQLAGLRTRGHVLTVRGHLLAVASRARYFGPSAYDGGRSRSPLRGSPGFPPGSLLRHLVWLTGRTSCCGQPTGSRPVRNADVRDPGGDPCHAPGTVPGPRRPGPVLDEQQGRGMGSQWGAEDHVVARSVTISRKWRRISAVGKAGLRRLTGGAGRGNERGGAGRGRRRCPCRRGRGGWPASSRGGGRRPWPARSGPR